MRASRALGLGIIAFQLVSMALLGLSLHAIIGILMGVQQENSFKMSSTLNESTGDLKLTLEADPRNQGFIGITFSIDLAVMSLDNVTLARNSTSIYIEPGSDRPFTLTLFVQGKDLPDMDQPGDKGIFELQLNIRTLGDTVGFRNIIRIRGGIGG